MTAYLVSAVALGFFSGGHCLGMCGPLVLALPVSNTGYARSLLYRIFYNTGRILTYAFLGAIVGLAGLASSFRGWQAKISYAAGMMLIIFSLIQLMPFIHIGFFSGIHARIARLFASVGRTPGSARFLLLGAVNGFLPCGMVTAGLAASLAMADFSGSALYMLCFGLGTFPLMLAASLFGIYLTPKAKRILAVLGPVYGIALGLLLLLRPSLMLPHCH